MDFASFIRAIFALLLTLGLIGLAAVALRRYGPEALSRFGKVKGERRLKVVETLVLDPTRRLVLVSCDGSERLLLLGEGLVLASPDGAPAPAPKPPPTTSPKTSRTKGIL